MLNQSCIRKQESCRHTVHELRHPHSPASNPDQHCHHPLSAIPPPRCLRGHPSHTATKACSRPTSREPSSNTSRGGAICDTTALLPQRHASLVLWFSWESRGLSTIASAWLTALCSRQSLRPERERQFTFWKHTKGFSKWQPDLYSTLEGQDVQQLRDQQQRELRIAKRKPYETWSTLTRILRGCSYTGAAHVRYVTFERSQKQQSLLSDMST
jgi:hypothetical protein